MNMTTYPPFALSLSKGQPELVEGYNTSLRSVEGFDELSPNGFGVSA
ncbi:hypothetical protein VVT58_07865 [Sphingobium sp. SJ10-10]|nr:hypothetical protein [Sphingobium sp. SJ10-10]